MLYFLLYSLKNHHNKGKSVLNRLSLLLIEDDASLREELSLFLSDFFDTIDVASTAEDGYEKFLTTSYDLVITDIQLPRQDGLYLVGKIKKRVPSQMVIVISAYQEVDYFLKSIDLGIYSFLTKPFNSQHLIHTMIKATTQLKHKKQPIEEKHDEIVLHQGIIYYPRTKSLHVKGIEEELTMKEELLLSLLVKNINHFVSVEHIAQEVWQSDEINSSTLRALIKRLRDKLSYDDAIVNLKNRGYKLNQNT